MWLTEQPELLTEILNVNVGELRLGKHSVLKEGGELRNSRVWFT